MKPNGKQRQAPIELSNGTIFFWNDELDYHICKLKGSGLEPLMKFYQLMFSSSEKPTVCDIFAALEVWRQHVGWLYAIHHDQPAFLEEVREEWNEVREMQKHIYEKCERELERRKAAN